MQLRGPLVGPDRWWYHTLLKGTVRETLASYGSSRDGVGPAQACAVKVVVHDLS